MKGLFLYGINCTSDIWTDIQDDLSHFDIDYVEYPHSITEAAEWTTDIAKWVSDTYGGGEYDFLVGHSMGGIVALELAVKFGLKCRRIILIDSSLKPANPFYRNLMTADHMDEYGDRVLRMLRSEAPYYKDGLKKSLQDDFDYSELVRVAQQEVYAIYGDRGRKEYANRIHDLCLDKGTLDKLRVSFIENACHMPMIENPRALSAMITGIVMGVNHPWKSV